MSMTSIKSEPLFSEKGIRSMYSYAFVIMGCIIVMVYKYAEEIFGSKLDNRLIVQCYQRLKWRGHICDLVIEVLLLEKLLGLIGSKETFGSVVSECGRVLRKKERKERGEKLFSKRVILATMLE